MSDSKFTLDASQAFSTLDGLNRAIGELESRFKRLPSAVRESFRPNISGNFVSQVKSADQAAEGLKKELEGVSAKNASAFNDNQVKDYAKALASAETAADGLKKASGDMERLNQFAGTGRQLFQGLLGVAGGIGAALSLGEAIRSGVELNQEYEKVKASLTVILKDVDKAEALIGKLNRFAAATPFGTDQVNEAARALLAFGESEQTVIESLEQIGSIASGTGKDFNELAIIYGKARVAGVLYAEDINQLLEAGVPIIGEFAKQLGVSEAEVKKLASQGKINFAQLQTAFKNLTTEGGRFAGQLKVQSETAAGLQSTLRSVFSERLRQATSGFSQLIKEITKGFITLLDTTQKESSALEDQRVKFLALSNEVKLANEGTQRRSDLIGKLQQQYPQFLGNVDKEKVTNQQLQPILDQINKSYIIRIALQKQQEKLQPLLEAQAEAEAKAAEFRAKQNRLLVKAAEITGVNTDQFKTQEDQINAVTAALQKQARFGISSAQDRLDRENRLQEPLNEQAKLLGEIQALGGQTAVTARSRALAEEATTEAQRQQQAVAEELKKTYGELFDIATAPPPDTTVNTTTTVTADKKGKSAADLEFERREQDLQKRRLLLNDLEDGLDKELEIIRLHFDSLKLEYEKAGLDISGLIAKQADAEINAISESLIKQVEADSEAVERRKKAGLAYVDSQKAELEAQKALRESEILLTEEGGKRVVEAMRLRGAKEREIQEFQRDFDREIQRQRLEAELAFQQALLAITDTGNAQQVQEITNRIELIKSQLETLRLSGLKAQDTKKRTLLDLLGIDINSEDGQRALQTLEEAGQRIVSSIQSITQARVEAAEAEVGIADQRVQEAEDALDREIELAQAGFANNVDLRRRELEDAKKAREQAVKQQQAALRTQLAVDTAVQASNIITSTTNLIKSWSTLPFGVGLISAAAQIAGIFALITNIKSRAAAITGRARYGADGHIGKDGIVRGRMHSQGGEKLEVERGELVQVLADGTKKRVHVIRRENVQQYSELLRAANSGDKEKMATEALKMADISSLPASIQNRIFSAQLNTQALSERTSTYYQSTPTLSRHAVAERVFHTTNNNTTVVQAADNTRTNEILLKMLEVMTIKPKEQWSADGKTRWRGNVKTKFT